MKPKDVLIMGQLCFLTSLLAVVIASDYLLYKVIALVAYEKKIAVLLMIDEFDLYIPIVCVFALQCATMIILICLSFFIYYNLMKKKSWQ